MPEVEVPPERVERKFSEWEERYRVEDLEELSVSDLKSELARFENEALIFKKEYHPGRLVTPEMAAVMGNEPLTQDQFREVRRLIEDEANTVRMNFKRAIGRREERRKERRGNLVADVAGRVSSSLTDVSISIELPKLR